MTNIQKLLEMVLESLTNLTKKVDNLLESYSPEFIKSNLNLPLLEQKLTKTKKQIKDSSPKKKTASKKKAAPKAAPAKVNTQALVLDIVKNAKKEISLDEIRKKAKLDTKQVSNALNRLKTNGKIDSIKRGIYVMKQN